MTVGIPWRLATHPRHQSRHVVWGERCRLRRICSALRTVNSWTAGSSPVGADRSCDEIEDKLLG
jgi:hypothetical protein